MPPILPQTMRNRSGKVYRLSSNRMGLTAISFHFDAPEYFTVRVSIKENAYLLNVGREEDLRLTDTGPSGLPTAMGGCFIDQDRLLIHYREVGGVNHFDMHIRFSAKGLTIHVDDPSGYLSGEIIGYL